MSIRNGKRNRPVPPSASGLGFAKKRNDRPPELARSSFLRRKRLPMSLGGRSVRVCGNASSFDSTQLRDPGQFLQEGNGTFSFLSPWPF